MNPMDIRVDIAYVFYKGRDVHLYRILADNNEVFFQITPQEFDELAKHLEKKGYKARMGGLLGYPSCVFTFHNIKFIDMVEIIKKFGTLLKVKPREVKFH